MPKRLKEINKTLAEHEQIKKFRLVTEEWSPVTNELSPTLKLKRNIITSRYSDLIADIYSNNDKTVNGKNGKNGKS
jgi:long-chain acyl-CoA synthetase